MLRVLQFCGPIGSFVCGNSNGCTLLCRICGKARELCLFDEDRSTRTERKGGLRGFQDFVGNSDDLTHQLALHMANIEQLQLGNGILRSKIDEMEQTLTKIQHRDQRGVDSPMQPLDSY